MLAFVSLEIWGGVGGGGVGWCSLFFTFHIHFFPHALTSPFTETNVVASDKARPLSQLIYLTIYKVLPDICFQDSSFFLLRLKKTVNVIKLKQRKTTAILWEVEPSCVAFRNYAQKKKKKKSSRRIMSNSSFCFSGVFSLCWKYSVVLPSIINSIWLNSGIYLIFIKVNTSSTCFSKHILDSDVLQTSDKHTSLTLKAISTSDTSCTPLETKLQHESRAMSWYLIFKKGKWLLIFQDVASLLLFPSSPLPPLPFQ